MNLHRAFGSDVGHHVIFHSGQSGDELVGDVGDALGTPCALPHADFLVLVGGEEFIANHHHGLHAPLPGAELRGNGSALHINLGCWPATCTKLPAIGAAVEHLVGGKCKREDVAFVAGEHRQASIVVAPNHVAILLERRVSAAALVPA